MSGLELAWGDVNCRNDGWTRRRCFYAESIFPLRPISSVPPVLQPGRGRFNDVVVVPELEISSTKCCRIRDIFLVGNLPTGECIQKKQDKTRSVHFPSEDSSSVPLASPSHGLAAIQTNKRQAKVIKYRWICPHQRFHSPAFPDQLFVETNSHLPTPLLLPSPLPIPYATPCTTFLHYR